MLNKLSKLAAIIIVMVFATSNAVAQQITFAKHKADLHEYLKITKIDAKKISYEIYMVNGECDELKRKGTAKLKPGGETDIDAEDNAYDVDEYVDNATKNIVYIRLGIQKGYTNKARFKIANEGRAACKPESDILTKNK
jgi:hypothetical protein